MNTVLDIQQRILETSAEIARLERALAERESRALSSSLKSLYKVRSGLESEFKEAAAASQIDVVSYRLFEGRERPTMALVGRALDSFQTLYAILYDAVSSRRPKNKARLSANAIERSAFEFGYAFAGSLGFVFTLPNERLLFETELDQAMQNFFSLARSSTREDIRAFGRTFGLAAIRAVHDWADALSISRTGADVLWEKAEVRKGSLILQPAEVQALRDLIALTTDTRIDERTFSGVLIGFDYQTRHFRFVPDTGGAMLRGYAAERAELPVRMILRTGYTATIRTTTRIRYSVEKPEVTHEMLALRDTNAG